FCIRRRQHRPAGDKSLFATNSRVLYANPNHLLFVRDGTLMAQPFDPARLTLSGSSFPVAEAVGATATGDAAFGVSANGTIVYRTATTAPATDLTWFDRGGKSIDVLATAVGQGNAMIAPDQAHVVVERRDAQGFDLWLIDVARRTNSRFTFD